MPVRGLRDFLEQAGLFREAPVSELRNLRIGVDGVLWLRGLHVTESMQVAMGGLPLGLHHKIDESLGQWGSSVPMQPLFVFSGLNLITREGPFTSSDGRLRQRLDAWEAYYRGNSEASRSMWSDSAKSVIAAAVPETIRHLRNSGHDTMRAPFLAVGQLGWLASQDMVQAVYGGLEMLMFDVHRLVYSIDWEAGTFRWISTQAVLAEVKLSLSAFIDACILAGWDQCSTFPPLLADGRNFSFNDALSMIRTFKSGLHAVRHFLGMPHSQLHANYPDVLFRTRVIVKHHLVLLPSGTCEPINKETAPADLEQLMGHRLPPLVYYLVCMGELQPRMLNVLLRGTLSETVPLVDSMQYRDAIVQLVPMRAKAVALLSSSLHRSFHKKGVKVQRWYEAAGSDISLDHHTALTPYQDAALATMFSDADVRKMAPAAVAQGDAGAVAQHIDLHVALKLAVATARSSTLDPARRPKVTADTEAAAVANALVTSLHMLEWAHPSAGVGALGRVVAALPTGTAHVDAAFVALYMLQAGMLKADDLTLPNEQPELPADCKAHILLVSRVLSLVPAQLGASMWMDAVDEDLAAFNCIVREVKQALRGVVEMTYMALLLRRQLQLTPQQAARVPPLLPFASEVNTAVGIVCKSFLLQPDSSVADVVAQFSALEDGVTALGDGVRLWNTVVSLVHALEAEADNPLAAKAIQAVKDADAFLQARLKETPISS